MAISFRITIHVTFIGLGRMVAKLIPVTPARLRHSGGLSGFMFLFLWRYNNCIPSGLQAKLIETVKPERLV